MSIQFHKTAPENTYHSLKDIVKQITDLDNVVTKFQNKAVLSQNDCGHISFALGGIDYVRGAIIDYAERLREIQTKPKEIAHEKDIEALQM